MLINPGEVGPIDKNYKIDKPQTKKPTVIRREQIPASPTTHVNELNVTPEQINDSLKTMSVVTLSEFSNFINSNEYEKLKEKITFKNVNEEMNGTKNQTVLHRCAMHVINPQNLDFIEYLARKGADFNLLDFFGSTPLLEAIANAQPATALAIAKVGLNYGIDLNKRPVEADPADPEFPFHNTALHLLIAKGYRDVSRDQQELSISYHEVAKALIQYGADPNIQDIKGDTPLHIAYLRHDQEAINLLLAHGSKLDIKNKQGKLPQEMSQVSYEEACKFLKAQAAVFLLDKKAFEEFKA